MQLDLPAPLDAVQREIFARALPARLASPEARVLLLAIGLQESGFRTRLQVEGPARGLWQFEQEGGIRGVLAHPVSRRKAIACCAAAGIAATEAEAYRGVGEDDLLACQFARLLLLTDPAPLPDLGRQAQAWDYYLRNWNPGRPRPDDWPASYQPAWADVIAGAQP